MFFCRFSSTKTFPHSEDIFGIFGKILPCKRNTFSAGRYTKDHHIEVHDDRAYKEIDGLHLHVPFCINRPHSTFIGHLYSRAIAVIYYLTKDWKEEDGGILVDLHNPVLPKTYIPQWNSAIIFSVPRYTIREECSTPDTFWPGTTRWLRCWPTGLAIQYSAGWWSLADGLHPLLSLSSMTHQAQH